MYQNLRSTNYNFVSKFKRIKSYLTLTKNNIIIIIWIYLNVYVCLTKVKWNKIINITKNVFIRSWKRIFILFI